MLRGSSVERDGTPLSASSLVLDWYLMLRRERERERQRAGREFLSICTLSRSGIYKQLSQQRNSTYASTGCNSMKLNAAPCVELYLI